MKLDYNKIIESRQENENTKYSDAYLEKKIKHRQYKLRKLSDNRKMFKGETPIGFSDALLAQKNDIIYEITTLSRIIDSL